MPSPDPERDRLIGQTIRQYQVLERLGSGAVGVVYKARDTRLGRCVALKFLAERYARDPEILARFDREARSASALHHPGICTIFEVGEHEGRPFIAMEFLDGQTLKDRLGGRPLPNPELLARAVEIASALEAIHALGIVHRDLKPGNVFLTEGAGAKVLDFGVAKFTSEETLVGDHLTETGATLGTVAYMSPEQARAEPLDARSDLFSFGAVLFEMATGRQAFGARSSGLVFDGVLNRDPLPASQWNPSLPPGLEHVLATALQKDRERRYRSAAQLRADLETLRDPNAIGRPDARATPGPPRREARAGVPVVLVALLTLSAPVSRGPAATPPYTSVAVLPFSNGTNDPDLEYLSDGITEGVINDLSRLRGLRVVPRSTAFRYRGREAEAPTLGRELNAAAVITGRVTVRDGSLTVGAELVDAAREAQVWGQRFTRPIDDLFALQGEVARAVSERLQPALAAVSRKRLGDIPSRDGDAYRLYLRGRHQWDKRSVEGITRSISFYESAIARDPGLAVAYAGLADAYVALRDLPPKETRPKARAAALRALELDNTLPEAHTSLAMTRFVYDWDWPEAERGFRRAIELSPEHATAHHWYGLFLMARGRFDEARSQLRVAYEKDPLSPMIQVNLGRTELYAGQDSLALVRLEDVARTEEGFAWAHGTLSLVYARLNRFDDAVRSAERARALDDAVDAPAWAGYAYAVAGRKPEAVRVTRELEAIAARRYLPPFRVALVYAALGDKDRAFTWLAKAHEDRSPWLAYVKHDPTLHPLRSDPRFDDLLRRVGLR